MVARANGEFHQHEYIHFFVNNNLPAVPLWLNEGLPAYYSTFESDDHQAKAGRPAKHHLAFLRSETLMPLAQLFTIVDAAVLYHEETKQELSDAQSPLLVHYFLHVQQGGLPPAFSQFWTLLAQVLFEKVITPCGSRAQIVEARERLAAIKMEKAVAWLEQGKNEDARQALKRVQAAKEALRYIQSVTNNNR